MNILYIVRNDLWQIFGGDTIQIEKTKEYTEKLYDANITIIYENNFTLEALDYNYDIYHFWGIGVSSQIGEIIEKLKNKNKHTIISSIYWDLTDSIFIKYFTQKILNYKIFPIYEILVKVFISYIFKPMAYLSPKYRKKMMYVWGTKIFKYERELAIKNADMIIPNSSEEGIVLCKTIGLSYDAVKNKFLSVPNSVDIAFINKSKPTVFMSDVKDFVIEAAGIEPLKNQLSIVRALYDNPEIPIIFAGAIRNEEYYHKIKRLADKRGNVYFTGKIAPKDLFSLYKRAKVHVLASFRESPGLATLEALMCGSQIVVSNEKYCPIKYYKFDKYGFVCNPYDVKSIRNAILEAYNHPKDISLPDEYIKFFSYENVANMTYNVYERVLSEKQ